MKNYMTSVNAGSFYLIVALVLVFVTAMYCIFNQELQSRS